jgi:broad specificity phosphatase PhoE
MDAQHEPLNIYLVRHGQTEGNVQRSLYVEKADHAIRLTPLGIEQAEAAGAFLADRLANERLDIQDGFGKIRVWFSPYYRARETAGHILTQFAKTMDTHSGVISYREEPFLIEQKAGLFDGLDEAQFKDLHPRESEDYAKHLRYNGRAYAKSPMGESRLDVVIRVKHVFGTIVDDYRTHNMRHVIVVSHGVTLRAFVMGWMRYSPEWLDAERNPGNGWIRHLRGSRTSGYIDEGYIHGHNAPLGDPAATQRHLENADAIFMLKPDRPGTVVPPGVRPFDPFAKA